MMSCMSNIQVVKHRPFLTPIWMTIGTAALAFVAAVFLVWVWGTADSTTVIVIRHAEKESVEGDPKLTDAGRSRAALLASMLGDASRPGHLGAIYVTDTARTQLTAAPLAKSLGLVPVVMKYDAVEAVARRALHEQSGGRALIVGHSDTVPRIVEELSGSKQVAAIADDDFGEMYIVTVPRIGRTNVLRLRY
jgi:2,3-bisphosphoglycerate-dependent phosphoglycerate mutase